jgi:hypothetical protein
LLDHAQSVARISTHSKYRGVRQRKTHLRPGSQE